MVNVLEVFFKNSFLEVALGLFLSPVGEISTKKKNIGVLKLGILAITPT
jgi:hypothetical protein